MYQKLNQNRKLKWSLAAVAVGMLFGFAWSLPVDEVMAQNVWGTFYGGRIVYFSPGYPWVLGVPPLATYGVCPPHMVVMSLGAPYRGPLAVTVPPISPRMHYNYYTPGNAVTGGYYPAPPLIFPGPLSCPDAPLLFTHSIGGTSAVPGTVPF